ncbi:MAG: diguanylate cyclase [Omnitrophica bacterium]|nr:diguanylate cyclase [Candidatus Omnitrophota bacterium]
MKNDKKQVALYGKVAEATKGASKEFGLIVKVSSIVCEYLGAEKVNFLIENHKALEGRVDTGVLVPIETIDNKPKSAWHIINAPRAISAEQESDLRTTGHFLTLAIENIILREQAIVDSLTKLYNRAYLDLRLREEIDKNKRYNTPFSLLMLDIDHFKAFNDDYGHAAGDEVLRIVAKVLRSNVRTSDIVFRYGGEEFAVYLQNITKKDTPRVVQRLMQHINATIDTAERLRQTVKKSSFVQHGKRIPITISIGISTFVGGSKNLTIESVIKRADESLYHAKQMGRDRSAVVGRDEVLKLLIVDDEAEYCRLLKNHFTERGYNVSVASSGEAALTLLGQHQFDIMLLDLKMPGITGLDVLQRLPQAKKKMKILILSAVEDENVKKISYEFGACEFLQKPVSIEYLSKHLMARILEMKA